MSEPGRALGLTDHGGAEGMQSRGGTNRVTARDKAEPESWTQLA